MYTCLTACQRHITHREESNNETYIFRIRKQVHVLTEFAGNNHRKECEIRREGKLSEGSDVNDAERGLRWNNNDHERKCVDERSAFIAFTLVHSILYSIVSIAHTFCLINITSRRENKQKWLLYLQSYQCV